MGDIVHAMVALQFIKQKYPDAIIDWIVQENFKDILKNNPDINNILPVDLKSIKKQKSLIFDQIKLLTQYSKNNYDITIDAQGLIKSAIVSKIVGSRIVNSIIVGFDKNSIREKVASWFYDKKINIPYHANTIDRNVKVICGALDIDVSKDQIINKKRFLYFDPISLKLEDEFILFVVGSTWESRNYPKEKFVQIANSLKKQVYVVWGTQQEYQKALYMQQHSKYIKPLPKVNLDELKAVELNGHKIGDLVAEKSGIIGEKIELGGFASVADEMVVPYIHPGNKLATLVAFNKVIDAQAGRDIAMQVAAMSPVSVDKENVPESAVNAH
jgi:heptosyltransferase-1